MSRFGVDRQAIDDLLTTTSADLREAIWLLIERRERMRDQESIRLDAESGQLLDKIDTIDRDKLVEELRCFRDVLAPHRQLVEKQLRGMTSSTRLGKLLAVDQPRAEQAWRLWDLRQFELVATHLSLEDALLSQSLRLGGAYDQSEIIHVIDLL